MSAEEGIDYILRSRADFESYIHHPFPEFNQSEIAEVIYIKMKDKKPTHVRFFPDPEKKQLEINLQRIEPNGRNTASGTFGLKRLKDGSLGIFRMDDYEWFRVAKLKPSSTP